MAAATPPPRSTLTVALGVPSSEVPEDAVNLRTALAHGRETPLAHRAPLHTALRTPGAQHDSIAVGGSAAVVGTKLQLCTLDGEGCCGCAVFPSAVRLGNGSSVSLELLGLQPGAAVTLLLAAGSWQPTALPPSWLHIPSHVEKSEAWAAEGFPVGALALQVHRLMLDRAVMDISVWGREWTGTPARLLAQCRCTGPDPCLLTATVAGSDLVVALSDVFLRRVRLPVLRAVGAMPAMLPAWLPPVPITVAALGHAELLHAEEAAPPAPVQDGAGAKPWLCPDGKRFATERNALRWMAKCAAAAAAVVDPEGQAAPASSDANAVLSEMSAREATAQALDAAAATITGSISTPNFSVAVAAGGAEGTAADAPAAAVWAAMCAARGELTEPTATAVSLLFATAGQWPAAPAAVLQAALSGLPEGHQTADEATLWRGAVPPSVLHAAQLLAIGVPCKAHATRDGDSVHLQLAPAPSATPVP